MKKILMILAIVCLLFFGGCSGGKFWKSSGAKEIDKTGSGLTGSFSLDDEYIQQRKLQYTLKLKNTGLEPITLTPENVKLTTKQVLSEGSNIVDVFTQESLNSFYEKLFKNSELKIDHDVDFETSGILEIKEDFYNDLNNEKLDYVLDIDYDYVTKFTNNLELSYKNEMYSLNVLDAKSQAAPIQVIDIKLVPSVNSEEYSLEYYVSDKGQSSDISPAVKVDKLEITFRNDNVGSSCKGVYENKRSLELEEIAVRKGTNLVLKCPITMNDESSFTTKTFGELGYNYKMRFDGSVKLKKEDRS